jgi:hypothetical protein
MIWDYNYDTGKNDTSISASDVASLSHYKYVSESWYVEGMMCTSKSWSDVLYEEVWEFDYMFLGRKPCQDLHILMQLSAQEHCIEFCHCESFKTYRWENIFLLENMENV